MISSLLFICLGITFFSTLFLVWWWIKRARLAGLVARDMNKRSSQRIPELGGLPVLAGFLLGTLLYLGVRTFAFRTSEFNLEIVAALTTVTFLALIGLLDDILGWKIGLQQWQKPVLCLFAALPVMMINAGQSVMIMPILGRIDFGIFYPLIIIPLAISAASNSFNMLAGFNGLEAGLGIIMLGALGFVVWQYEQLGIIAMLAAIMIAALAAFLLFNHYPAKVFPGDTLTYMVGGLIAVIAIMGNAEKAALYLFIPFIIEFFLKARGAWSMESFAKLKPDSSLTIPYKKIYGLTHAAIAFSRAFKKRVSETDVVYALYCLELLFVVVMFVLL